MRIIEQVRTKSEVNSFDQSHIGVRIFMSRNWIPLASLPTREATTEERRMMMGSIGTCYEMKIPLVYSSEFERFFLISYFRQVCVVFEKETELVCLRSTQILQSVFRKTHRKPKQDWNSSVMVK